MHFQTFISPIPCTSSMPKCQSDPLLLTCFIELHSVKYAWAKAAADTVRMLNRFQSPTWSCHFPFDVSHLRALIARGNHIVSVMVNKCSKLRRKPCHFEKRAQFLTPYNNDCIVQWCRCASPQPRFVSPAAVSAKRFPTVWCDILYHIINTEIPCIFLEDYHRTWRRWRLRHHSQRNKYYWSFARKLCP